MNPTFMVLLERLVKQTNIDIETLIDWRTMVRESKSTLKTRVMFDFRNEFNLAEWDESHVWDLLTEGDRQVTIIRQWEEMKKQEVAQ